MKNKMRFNIHDCRQQTRTIVTMILASFLSIDSPAQSIDKKTVIKPAVKTTQTDSKEKTISQSQKQPVKKVKSNTVVRKETSIKKKTKKENTSDSHTYIAVKTNLPFDIVGIQNLSLEVQVHKNITIDFPVMWSIGDIERKHGVKAIAFQPEGRWWLKSVEGGRHFFGIHAHAAWFNLKWNDTRYQTEKRPLFGAGISYGYRLPMSTHWATEFNVGFGYANMKYNTYYNIENGARLGNETKDYWGITRIGISLAYRF